MNIELQQVEKTQFLPVIEIFGPVIQGEGAVIGLPTHFIRFAGCDYRCSWCDSMYAVDPVQIRGNVEKLEVHEIYRRLIPLGDCRTVTLSGGNPVLHDLQKLVLDLKSFGYRVILETQGTVWKRWMSLLDHLIVSPKPPSSAMTTDYKKLDEVLTTDNKVPLSVKVVVFDESDLIYANVIRWRYPTLDFYLQVGSPQYDPTQPFDINDIRETILARYDWLCQKVMSDLKGWETGGFPTKILPQLQTLSYGHRRGV